MSLDTQNGLINPTVISQQEYLFPLLEPILNLRENQFILSFDLRTENYFKEKMMATVVDMSFDNLVEGGSKVIRRGLSGTRMIVYPDPEFPEKGTIIEYNSTGKVIGSWVIKAGKAYRVTPHRVKQMPLVENDPDPVRRYCRMNGISLTKIKVVSRGEVIHTKHPHYQGDNGDRFLSPNDPPAMMVHVHTTGNPSVVWFILVDRDAQITWDELSLIANEWEH